MSLPAQHRLRHRQDFSRVYQYGERYSSKNLVIRVLQDQAPNQCFGKGLHKESKRLSTGEATSENGDRPPLVSDGSVPDNSTVLLPLPSNQINPTKIGISVSQKVSKRAVVRNRIKRQLKATIRNMMPCLNQGWLIVIGVRPSAVQCDYWQFLQELEQTLKLTEVWNGHS